MSDHDDDSQVAYEDLAEIAARIIEMADRLKVMHQACPGAAANWAFELDGKRFKLRMTVDDQNKVQR